MQPGDVDTKGQVEKKSDWEQSRRHLLRIGCAGWSIPKPYADRFPLVGTHLERFARMFNAVEINSSFYRPHMPSTYERWRDSVPDEFRFAVKVPKIITHTLKLKNATSELVEFLGGCEHLGSKLGPLLVQLPPGLAFDRPSVDSFFRTLRDLFDGDVACEPRHASWFGTVPDSLLVDYHIARVAADPSVVPEAAEPGGWSGLVYYRLHGSPRIYYSAYPPGSLQDIAHRLIGAAKGGAQTWCIFDNTADGAATGDALTVMAECQL